MSLYLDLLINFSSDPNSLLKEEIKDIVVKINKIFGLFIDEYFRLGGIINSKFKLHINNDNLVNGEDIFENLQKLIQINIKKFILYIKNKYDFIILNDILIHSKDIDFKKIIDPSGCFSQTIRSVFLELLDAFLLTTTDFILLINYQPAKIIKSNDNNLMDVEDDIEEIDNIIAAEAHKEKLLIKFNAYKEEILIHLGDDYLNLMLKLISPVKPETIHPKFLVDMQFIEVIIRIFQILLNFIGKLRLDSKTGKIIYFKQI